MEISWIKAQIKEGDYEFSAHAEEERQAAKLTIGEVEHAFCLMVKLLKIILMIQEGQAVLSWGTESSISRFMWSVERQNMVHCG